MEEDILNYLPTVMFRGTPCMSIVQITMAPFAWSSMNVNNFENSLFSIAWFLYKSDMRKHIEELSELNTFKPRKTTISSI